MSDRENPQEAWLERVRKEYVATSPPQGARKRIEEALQSEPAPGSRRMSGLELRARPWLIAAGVTVVLGAALWVAVSSNRDQHKGRVASTPLASAESTAVVRFVVSAPGASTVSLVGDFNGWDTTAAPMRKSNAGLWTVSLPVSHGRHVYAFVVNRSRWISDPDAPLSPEDGFGVSSSVLVVGGGT